MSVLSHTGVPFDLKKAGLIVDLRASGFETSLSGIPYTSQDTGVGFGVLSGSDLTTSRTIINTIDLISEGQIEGLVSGVHNLSGLIGQTGYSTGEFISYGDFPDDVYRSIYLNEVPVTSAGIDGKSYYNFQDFKFALSDGDAVGIRADDNFLLDSDALKTQKSRTINERIYGPESNGTIYPKAYKVLNSNLGSFIINVKIPSLSFTKAGSSFTASEQNEQVGSTITFNTQYRPLYRDGSVGAWETDGTSQSTTVSGLITNAYLFSIKTTPNYSSSSVVVENLIGWEFQITRSTLDSINAFVQNESFIDSTTEIFKTSLSYPNSAVIASQFNAEFFSQIPNRAFDVKLLKVKVPSNYDPVHRNYSGTWDGTFKSQKYWTDNPAWIFYDLVTNKRYGLGKYIEAIKIDKWTLFKIAQYCDVLVDDGNDGVEPRFSANVYINSREEAFKVLQDFASIFRGIVYYGLGNINAIQDCEREPVIQFTNANVEDGDFSYTSTAKKTRYSVAIVRYNDKENFYKPALEYIEDVEAIRKYGIRETEVTAFGCTSKAQAIRLGRWILHTNSHEQETVSFSAGLESLLVRPGDLIRIADKNRGLNLTGGRALDISATGVTLDRYVNIKSSTSYSLTLTNPTHFYDPDQTSSDSSFESSDISDIRKSQINKIDFTTDGAGSATNFVFSSGIVATGIDGPIYGSVIGFPSGSIPAAYNKETGLAWSLDDNVYEPEYYNVIDIRENSDLNYEISATKHYSGKFAAIESGITFTPKDPNLAGTAAPPPNPTGITASLQSLTSNSKKITYVVGCPSSLGTTSHYEVYVKTGSAWGDSSDFINPTDTKPIPKQDFKINTIPAIPGQTTLTSDYVPPVNNTGYYFLAYALNAAGTYSNGYAHTSSPVNVTNHFPIKDVNITNLRLTSDSDATNNAATKDAGDAGIINPSSKDQTFTWDVTFADQTPPIKLDYRVTVREPVSNSALTGTLRETYGSIQSRTFDFPFTKNAAITNGPFRHYDLAVEARDVTNGGYSTDGSSNPSAGYDIVEVNNKRPSGYWMTPRHYSERGARPGDCQAYEDLCTEQIITSDGKIRLLLRQFGAQFNDLVGGYIYLSAKPFTTGDFSFAPNSPLGGLTGVPDNVRREDTLGLTTDEEKEEHKIVSIPFVDTVVHKECTNTSVNSCSSNGAFMNSNLIVATANFESTTPLRLGFDKTYHMAISFFDSFDYALSGINPTSFNNGQWVGFARPYVHSLGTGLGGGKTQRNLGFYTGHTAASANASGVFEPVLGEEDYQAYNSGTLGVIPAPYFQNTGDGLKRSRFTGFASTQVHMSKFTSAAGLSPYHAWVRLNVNGHWEGNGIERVRILSAKDIDVYYNYNGFFEYSCQFFETTDGGGQLAPNDADSRSVCRFTQGKVVNLGYPTFRNQGILFQDDSIDASMTLTGLRVGLPLFWQSGYLSGTKYSSASLNDENITSYNETGGTVKLANDPTITATRPLHGFRRFRVYFDENNLPPENAAGSLASYSVVGMNAWNGKYAAWPGGTNPSNNLLFEKEGTDIFSSGTVQTWLNNGDVFENIPGVWNHHPAGFGQGYGGLIKTQKYFDVHMGRLVDDSYLEEAIFSVVTTNDYSISLSTVDHNAASWGSYDAAMNLTNGYYVHDFDKGFEGLGMTPHSTEAQALSGWYRADDTSDDPYP